MELYDDNSDKGFEMNEQNMAEPEIETVVPTETCMGTEEPKAVENMEEDEAVETSESGTAASDEAPEPQPPDNGIKRCWKKVKGGAGALWAAVWPLLKKRWGRIIAIVLLVFVALTALRIYNSITAKKDYYESLSQTITEMKQISEFCTAHYIGEVMVSDEEIVFLKKKTIVLIVKGTVRAGFDLTKMQTEVVDDTTINVTIPPAQVLDIITNPSDIRTFSEKGSWSHEKTTIIKNTARAKLLELVMEDKLLETAEENGIRQLRTIFMAFGFKKVNISIANCAEGSDFETIVGDSVSDNVVTLFAN